LFCSFLHGTLTLFFSTSLLLLLFLLLSISTPIPSSFFFPSFFLPLTVANISSDSSFTIRHRFHHHGLKQQWSHGEYVYTLINESLYFFFIFFIFFFIINFDFDFFFVGCDSTCLTIWWKLEEITPLMFSWTKEMFLNLIPLVILFIYSFHSFIYLLNLSI